MPLRLAGSPVRIAVPAAALADWFSDPDEEMRVCSDLQTRGELALVTTSPTPH